MDVHFLDSAPSECFTQQSTFQSQNRPTKPDQLLTCAHDGQSAIPRGPLSMSLATYPRLQPGPCAQFPAQPEDDLQLTERQQYTKGMPSYSIRPSLPQDVISTSCQGAQKGAARAGYHSQSQGQNKTKSAEIRWEKCLLRVWWSGWRKTFREKFWSREYQRAA